MAFAKKYVNVLSLSRNESRGVFLHFLVVLHCFADRNTFNFRRTIRVAIWNLSSLTQFFFLHYYHSCFLEQSIKHRLFFFETAIIFLRNSLGRKLPAAFMLLRPCIVLDEESNVSKHIVGQPRRMLRWSVRTREE